MASLDGNALVEIAKKVSDRDEFCSFVEALMENLHRHPGEWENVTLDEFLRGLADFSASMERYYANTGEDIDCTVPSWRVFADILLAARVYE